MNKVALLSVFIAGLGLSFVAPRLRKSFEQFTDNAIDLYAQSGLSPSNFHPYENKTDPLNLEGNSFQLYLNAHLNLGHTALSKQDVTDIDYKGE